MTIDITFTVEVDYSASQDILFRPFSDLDQYYEALGVSRFEHREEGGICRGVKPLESGEREVQFHIMMPEELIACMSSESLGSTNWEDMDEHGLERLLMNAERLDFDKVGFRFATFQEAAALALRRKELFKGKLVAIPGSWFLFGVDDIQGVVGFLTDDHCSKIPAISGRTDGVLELGFYTSDLGPNEYMYLVVEEAA